MSWMKQLYLTYDEISKRDDEDNALTPLAHQYAKAQLEVILQESGELVAVNLVDKDDARTLIPVTEASSGRSSGVAPHALCDTLAYVVKDFSKYCKDEKDKKMAEKKYEAYIRNLKKWCESEYSHAKVRAVYKYLTSGLMLEDLIKKEIIHIDEACIYQDEKIVGQPYDKALVRFKVIMHDLDNNFGDGIDMSLINAYSDFYQANQDGRRDICYFSGVEKVISDNHPKGVVPIAGNAKLVSANDSSGYTFRGRFRDAEQASALSYEASQKIHSALAWLVKNQGETIGTKDTRTFICWNPQGKKTIPLFGDIYGSEEEENVDVDYGRRFRNTLRGYKDQFAEDENIMVMGLEAATAGRLSITYYNEFSAREFWDRIEQWYDICNWKYFDYKRKKEEERSPTFKQIVQCAFGTEKGNFIDVSDKVLKEQTQRLMKCMLEGEKVPLDIVNALANRASTPTAYSHYNRASLLSTACAVIKKYYFDKKGEKVPMKLDLNNTDRSYLFGRLLAIYDCAERRTYDNVGERDTNAVRLQSAFVNHPMQTWLVLEEVMNPYFKKLGANRSGYYKTMISEIVEMIQNVDELELNKRLKETYLLGYYLQRSELYKKKDEKQEVENNE